MVDPVDLTKEEQILKKAITGIWEAGVNRCPHFLCLWLHLLHDYICIPHLSTHMSVNLKMAWFCFVLGVFSGVTTILHFLWYVNLFNTVGYIFHIVLSWLYFPAGGQEDTALTVQYYCVICTHLWLWPLFMAHDHFTDISLTSICYKKKPDTWFENGFIEESIISPGINQNSHPIFVQQPLIHIRAPSCSHYCTSLWAMMGKNADDWCPLLPLLVQLASLH